MASTKVFIFDPNFDLQTILRIEGDGLPFYSPIHKYQVFNADTTAQAQAENSLNFMVPANDPKAAFVIEGNYAAFKDLDDEWQMFEIRILDDYHDEELYKNAYCVHIGQTETNDDWIDSSTLTNVDAATALGDVLSAGGSDWQVGTVASLGTFSLTISRVTVLNALAQLVQTWGGEISFRVEVSENQITGRYIDWSTRIGADRGKRFEYGKDVESIQKTTDLSNLKTALYGYGAADDSGNRLTFANVAWSTSAGDPVDKPLGQTWVGDPSALAQWGRNNGTKHRFGMYDGSDLSDPAALLNATWANVLNQNTPLVSYQMKVAVLEQLTGESHEKTRNGDTVKTIDSDFKPAMRLEARILEFDRDLVDYKNSVVTLGNFLPTTVDNSAQIKSIQRTLNDNAGVWSSGGNAISTVTDSDFPDTVPATPTNLVATGGFQTILLSWDYDPSTYIAAYEVYASQTANFTPQTTDLVWRGKAGGYDFNAAINQQWYFVVRAINTHGTPSAYTTQVMAQTAQINGNDYIAKATIGDALIHDVSADKMTTGTLDAGEVNVINLDADNINAGTLKAQFVKIGSTTTYETGYNPSTKAEYSVGATAPTNTNVIWIDNSNPTNVIWKAYDSVTSSWKAGPSGPQGPQGLQGIQGPQGDQGIQGPTGANGLPSYTHIAYATSADGSQGFSVSDATNKTYLGIYNDSTATDSSDYTKYTWSLIKGADGSQGIQGPAGPSGQTSYFHIAYATSADGSQGFDVSNATGKTYIGTYTDFTAADSTDHTKYTWALIQGPQGPTGPQGSQGIQGPPGSNGQSLYTWIKYATSSTGANMSDSPTGMTYIGLAYNKTTATESTTATDYTWSLIQGSQGIQGPTGPQGQATYTWIKYATSSSGANMSDSPSGMTYMGIAYNKTTATESTTASDYAWSLIQGPQGPQGIQGPTGPQGQATYTWIKYATSSSGANMSDSPSGMTYIGIAYNKTTATESTVASDYSWSLIQGPQGSQGIQGPTGPQGQATYTWIKYGTSATGANMSDSPSGMTYIGIAYNKTTATESTVASDYSWSLIQGPQGPQGPQGSQGVQGPTGPQGQSLFTWVKYSTSSTGANMSDSPSGMTYIGFAYNKTTATKSTTASDYTWSLIQGPQGIQGPTGPQGQITYTWLKYADSPTTGMSDSPTGKTYMGIAYNKTTATESTTYSDYSWSLIQGPQGPNKVDGTTSFGDGYDPTKIQVGARNLFVQSDLTNVTLVDYKTIEGQLWAITILDNTWVLDYLKPNTEYAIGYDVKLIAGSPSNYPLDVQTYGSFNLYNSTTGTSIYLASLTGAQMQSMAVNDVIHVEALFTTPADLTNYKLLAYTARYTDGTNVELADMQFSNVQIETGNKHTDWRPAPEDVQNQLSDHDTRISNVEILTTSDAIIQTVTQSDDYTQQMATKANASDLGNLATQDQLTQAGTDANNYTDSQIGKIDFTPYVTQTQLTETKDGVNVDISKSGGVNMVKNSVGFVGVNFWDYSYTDTTITNVVNDGLDELGFGSGFNFLANGANKGIQQDVSVQIGQTYTLSWLLNKTTAAASGVTDQTYRFWVQIQEDDGTGTGTFATMLQIDDNSNDLTTGYESNALIYTATTTTLRIRFIGYANVAATLTGVMLNVGANALQWQLAPGEIYNTSVKMDLNGIKVSHIDGTTGQETGFTVMTPDKFGGYWDANGDGVIDDSDGSPDEVFRMDQNNFIMQNAVVNDSINLGTIKAIPINASGHSGWALVSKQVE